jgi:quercetin dioxygenase-like cupin family protein
MSELGNHTYLRTHQLSGDVLAYDLDQESAAIVEAAKEADAGRAAKTLVKEGPLRLTIMGFSAGASLREHKAEGPLSIEVRSGLIRLSALGASYAMTTGDILVLDKAVPHSLVAESDAALLLSIAMVE